MDNNFYLLYMEPYVHINIMQSEGILYNTLDGNYKIINNNEILDFLSELNKIENLRILEIDRDKLKKKNFRDFIRTIRKYYMGDIIYSKKKIIKPIQIYPYLHIEQHYRWDSVLEKYTSLEGNNITNCLNSLSLYINNKCSSDCDSCSIYYRQFLHCKVKHNSIDVLEISKIKKVFEQIDDRYIRKINILGGNILEYSDFKRLVLFFNQIDSIKTFYIFYKNLYSALEKIKLLENHNGNNIISILINGEFKKEEIINLVTTINNYQVKFYFEFIIESEKDFENVQRLHFGDIGNFFMRAAYNHRNQKFFFDNIYFDVKEILNRNINQKKILLNGILNKNFFGNLIIDMNGDIRTDFSTNKLGNIDHSSIGSIIYDQLTNQGQWMFTRSKVAPCNTCVMNHLCPPISFQENYLRKFNMCTYKEENSCN